jgi:hypothetical protein
MTVSSYRYWRIVAALGTAGLLGGCREKLVGVQPAPAALHVRVRGSDVPFAVNIGDTLPLEALPVAADSAVVASAVAASWASSDTLKLTIDTEGVLRTRCVGVVTVTAVAVVAGRRITGRRPVTIGSFGAACAR